MKKYLTMLLVCVLVLCAVPVAVAAEAEVPDTPTGDGDLFFANGIPITISAQAPADGTEATIAGLSTGTSAYISWEENGATRYVGVGSMASVYGGADGRNGAVTVPSTNITMTGGRICDLYGGNRGDDGSGETSVVTGDVKITATGIIRRHCYGGGEGNTRVNGKITMYLEGVDGDTNHVGGGVFSSGGEGVGPAVEEVEFTAVNCNFVALLPGSNGVARTEKAKLTATGCIIGYLYINGINGHTEESHVTVTDCTITDELAAVNRGTLGTGTADVYNCTIANFYSGATVDSFRSNSPSPDAFSGVRDSIVWNLDAETTVTSAYLTPMAEKKDFVLVSTNLGNVTINKEGNPLELMLAPYKANRDEPDTLVSGDITLDAGFTLELNGVNVTMGDYTSTGKACTLTNHGSILLGDNTTWNVASGTVLTNTSDGQIQVGSSAALNNEGTIQNDGTITVAYGGQTTGTVSGNAPVVQHKITLSVGEGGKASENAGELYVESGRDFTITFTPDEGNVVSRLVVDGEPVKAADSYTFTNLSADHTISVEFEKDTTGPASDNPATGDAFNLGAGAVVLLAAAGACALALRKRGRM